MIAKNPSDNRKYHYPVLFFDKARDALKAVLKELRKQGDFTLFMPAYIGISPKEGSGIFDPIQELGITYRFYHINREILIDVEDFEQLLSSTQGRKVVLLVDYFGYVDKAYEQINRIAHNHGAVVIEDAAHALFTDYVDGIAGRKSDYTIYSLHKMFAVGKGGMLRVRMSESQEMQLSGQGDFKWNGADYDLAGISLRRKENAVLWEELLNQCESIEILRSSDKYAGQTPQTFPVLLHGYDRFQLYQDLNERGYGIVSLYHTMIEPLNKLEFKESLYVAERIINFPVHQDIEKKDILEMYNAFEEIIIK